MKTIKKKTVTDKMNYLDRACSTHNASRKVDFSNDELGIRIINGKADLYAYGRKHTDADYLVFKLDYQNVAMEMSLEDFTFVANKVNEVDFSAVMTIDNYSIKISPKNPYYMEEKIILIVKTDQIIVQITLYNAGSLAPGLSGSLDWKG